MKKSSGETDLEALMPPHPAVNNNAAKKNSSRGNLPFDITQQAV